MALVELDVLGCPSCGAPFRTTWTSTVTEGLTPGYTLSASAADCWTDGVAVQHAWDGKALIPSRSPCQSVHRCRACQRYFWIRLAPVLRNSSPDPVNAAMPMGVENHRQGPVLDSPLSAASLYEAIVGGLARDRTEEKNLRLLAWQADNDSFRYQGYRPYLPSSTAFSWWGILVLPIFAIIFLWHTMKAAVRWVVLRRRRKRLLGHHKSGAHEFVRNIHALEPLLDSNIPDERLLLAELARQQGRFDRALDLLRFTFPAEQRQAADFMQQLALRKDPMLRRLET